eukprot:gene7185-9147_t
MRDHEQIRGIRGLQARSITARIGQDAWRGYRRGTEVIVEYDEEAFVGGSPLLMSAVLARFFAMYTSVNSFVRLAVRRGDERPPAGTLTGRLASRPHGFNLFQAISLLERAAPDMPAVGQGHGEPEAVRLNAVVSLGFQASDVSAVKAGSDSGEAFTLLSPVMSLAGAQGPLPLPFTEMVLERKAARDHATADFLDIFNHRFLAFLYRSRKKHHMGLNWREPQDSALAGSLDALSALGLRAGVRGPDG